MKAITIWQPWASLIIAGAKPYEFRGWVAPHWLVGQRIAIHAGARKMKATEVEDLIERLIADPVTIRQTGLISCIALPILRCVLAGLDHSKPGFLAERPASIHLPLASVLGTAVLGLPTKTPIVDGQHLIADSDRTDHLNWGWPLSEIERFEPPMPARGMQGIWTWLP